MTHPLSQNWQQVILKDITSKISDGIHTTPKYVDTSDYYFVNGNNLIKDSVFITDKTKCVSETEYEKHKRELNDSTVLLSINGTIGNVAYFRDEKVVLGKSAAYINCGEGVLRDFIFFFLKSSKTQYYFVNELTGSTIKNLSLTSIKKTPVSLPPLSEQHRIVAVLETWDKAIDKLERKIVLKQNVKKGLMQQLLTGKKRLPGFSGKWKEVKLGDVCKFQNGFPFESADFSEDSGIRIIRNRDLKQHNQIIFFRGSDIPKNYVVSGGDILIGMDGDFCVTKWNNGKALLNQRVGRLIEFRNSHPNFLYYKIQIPLKIIEQETSSTTVKHLSSKVFENFSAKIPTLNEQQEIAKILISADQVIELLQSKLQKLKDQKTYLLNNLITGRIRTLSEP